MFKRDQIVFFCFALRHTSLQAYFYTLLLLFCMVEDQKLLGIHRLPC